MHSDLFSVISSPISKGMIRRWIAQIVRVHMSHLPHGLFPYESQF